MPDCGAARHAVSGGLVLDEGVGEEESVGRELGELETAGLPRIVSVSWVSVSLLECGEDEVAGVDPTGGADLVEARSGEGFEVCAG